MANACSLGKGIYSLTTDLVKSSDDEVKVRRNFVELVSSKEMVDVLHLLDVGEQVPVVHCQVSGQLLSAVLLGKNSSWLLVLVRERWLGKGGGGGGGKDTLLRLL